MEESYILHQFAWGWVRLARGGHGLVRDGQSVDEDWYIKMSKNTP